MKSKPQTNDSLHSLFFGQRTINIVGAEKPERRIGVWPCLAEDDPLIVMGAWSLFTYGLTANPSVVLYRLFYLPTEDADDWSENCISFGVEALLLNQLNENTAIWGRLERNSGIYKLFVHVEDDFSNQQSVLSISGQSWHEVISSFDKLWTALTDMLELERTELSVNTQEFLAFVELPELLRCLAEWESRLSQFLQRDNGKLDVAQWQSLVERLHAWSSLNAENRSAGWVVAQALSSLSYVGYGQLAEVLVDKLDQLAKVDFQAWWIIGTVGAMLNLNQRERAFELVEVGLEQRKGSLLYNRLAALYRQDARLKDALNVLQSAIEQGVADIQTYVAYAGLLKDCADSGMRVDQYVLIEEDKDDDVFAMLYSEAIVALSLALEISPDDLSLLYMRASYELELGVDEFWEDFGQLVEEDANGFYIRDLVEAIAGEDELEEAIGILADALERSPQRIELALAYAAALVYEERFDEVLDCLESVRQLDTHGDYSYDVERLELAASIDNFEYRLAQIMTRVDAKSAITNAEIDFLESILEQSPHFVPAYLLLARSYHLIGDLEAALEVLAQAEEYIPNQVEIIDLMAAYLYEQGRVEEALAKVMDGLTNYPTDVLLLVRTGRLYFDLGEEQLSRQFIRQAEVLDHRHAALQALRVYIANQLSGN
ncbi:MAG: tetratricopeptide repeat protein [Anaerolineae bacterium]|nr:tetratricopeptide repeat protein [Anaerolineae bacterium]